MCCARISASACFASKLRSFSDSSNSSFAAAAIVASFETMLMLRRLVLVDRYR